MKKYVSALTLGVLMTLFACSSRTKTNTITESVTSGNIRIGVDESYQLMIHSQISLFESLYSFALIKAEYGPEIDILDLLMKDSIRLAVVTRQLNEAEINLLKSHQITPTVVKIAYDGLAFIVNKQNTDSNLLYQQVKDIFTGKIKTWKQMDPKSTISKNLEVIFDNNKSGNPRYVREKMKIEGKFPDNCFAVNSNEEVIKYVQNNTQAIGIISVNWISDKNDTVSNKFLKSVKVAGIGYEGDLDGAGGYLKPYQGNIADGSYPFSRDVYMISRECFTGLGTGFVQFVSGEKGQRVVLKSGLVPATMPIRLVNVHH